ncbi:MAG: HAD family hydrolase [Kiritimatiellaceae bacterium]|nr:HAD family hydrolase [Kiritimatiellaceae bacterium]
MGKGLILFDIDGTLLHAPGGREAFALAFQEAFGWEQGVEHINFYGATDLNVFRGICVERGVESTPDMERAFFERLAPALEMRLAVSPPTLFPNVGNILKLLSDENVDATPSSRLLNRRNATRASRLRWEMGLVTGNIEATAWAKLHHAGIAHYFDFGGFGCTHADRAEIARQALKASGVERPGKVFLIGDTPSDINAAKVNGFTAIAVATGGFDFQTLEKSGADFVFEDLTDTDRLLSILANGGLE